MSNLFEAMNKILNEDIVKPSSLSAELKEKFNKWKESNKDAGKVHFIITDDNHTKILGYITDKYVKELSEKEGKKYSPMGAAKRRLNQVEFFKDK